MHARRKLVVVATASCLGLGALGPLLGAPGAITAQAAEIIAHKIECHLVQMVAARVAAQIEEKAAGAVAQDMGAAPVALQPHTRAMLSTKALAALQQQACSTNAGVWKTLSQWCDTVTGSDWCSPGKAAAALCDKGQTCRAALDAVGRTRDAIKVAALAPFRAAWTAIRGRPLPISPTSVENAELELQAAEESDAAHNYGTSEPGIEDPATANATRTVAESGGGDAAQAAGDTSRAFELGADAADGRFLEASRGADAARQGENGDDGVDVGRGTGDVTPETAAALAAEEGASTGGKFASAMSFAKAGLKGALKVVAWAGLAWSAVDFLGEITANYTTSDAIQSSGWHYYGLLDVVPPSRSAGGILVSSDKVAIAGKLAAVTGSKVMSCEDLIDLEAQVLGDPTSVANAEIVGSFLDPTRSGHSDAPDASGGFGHVDQDKTIHDPLLNLVPAGKKTFDANLSDLLIAGQDGQAGDFGPLCNLNAADTPQPKTPNWRQVIEQAVARDKRLAGVVSTTATPPHPFGIPDGRAFGDWTLDDVYTFGLGADPLAHYGTDGDLLGKDESIVSGRCIAAMALTPYRGIQPRAYRDLLADLRRGNDAPYYRLLDAARTLTGAANANTHSCLYAPMEQASGSLAPCITAGADPLNVPPQVRALVADPSQCTQTPIWSQDALAYPPISGMRVDADGHQHFSGTDYPDVTFGQALAGVVHDCACTLSPEPSSTPADAIDFGGAAANDGYSSIWNSTDVVDTTPENQLQNQLAAMALALCDVFGEGDPLFTTAPSRSPTQVLGSGAGGGIGCAQMRPSAIGRALAEAAPTSAATPPADITSDEILDEAVVIALRESLATHHGDVRAAFADYVRTNHLPPYNGAWHGDARYEPGQAATELANEGLGDWSNELGLADGQHLAHVPTADLLVAAYEQYLLYLGNGDVGNQEAMQPPTGAAFVAGAGGLIFPPRAQMAGITAAATRSGVSSSLLLALAATMSNNTFDPSFLSSSRTADGSPVAYGEFQMTVERFVSSGKEAGLPASAFDPLPDTRAGPEWGEPRGEIDVAMEAQSAAQLLRDLGAVAAASTPDVELAMYRYVHGDADTAPSATVLVDDPAVASVVLQKEPLYAAWIAAGQPTTGGATPACTSGFCEVPLTVMFPWVPHGGFPDPYSFGQCTYFAALNVDPFRPGPVRNLGNGGDWYIHARGMGLPTLPPSVLPPYGSAVSYHGFAHDDGAGHVAVVISDDIDGHGYWVAEMNVIAFNHGTGRVDVAHHAFPDPFLMGSVLQPAT